MRTGTGSSNLIIFVIVCSLVYTIAQRLLRFEDTYIDAGGLEESAVIAIFQWVQNNYGYANILIAVFIALWIKGFFRKYDYNFFEILILMCFVIGIGMLMYTAFGVMESATGWRMLRLGSPLGFVYVSWAIGRFFDESKVVNYLKGLLSYILGMFSFGAIVFAVGTLVDVVMGG